MNLERLRLAHTVYVAGRLQDPRGPTFSVRRAASRDEAGRSPIDLRHCCNRPGTDIRRLMLLSPLRAETTTVVDGRVRVLAATPPR